MQQEQQPSMITIKEDKLQKFVYEILLKHQVPAENAAIVAKCLVQADLR